MRIPRKIKKDIKKKFFKSGPKRVRMSELCLGLVAMTFVARFKGTFKVSETEREINEDGSGRVGAIITPI